MEFFMVSSSALRTDGPTPDSEADGLAVANPALLVSCNDCGASTGIWCPGGIIHMSRERQAFHMGFI